MLKKSLLVIFWILGSAWVCCLVFAFVTYSGALALSRIFAADLTKGEVPAGSFYVMVVDDDGIQEVILLEELEKYRKKHPQPRFLLTSPEGAFSDNGESRRYAVKNQTASQQTIEVSYKGESSSSKSLYVATQNTVTPLRSEGLNPGHTFAAMLCALIIAKLLSTVANLLYELLYLMKERTGT